MKLSFFMLFMCIGLTYATESYSQSAVLSLNINNKTVQDVLDEIEKQSDFHFFYNNKQVDTNRAVSIKMNKQNVFTVLDQLFANTDISYRVVDKNIILSQKEVLESATLSQQSIKKITGTIKDEYGEPIIGANVVEKGSTNGTVTNLDGYFELTVPTSSTLVISYIGYITKELAVGNAIVFNVTLAEDSKSLDEVIVTALGIKREEKALGYSVQKVSAKDIAIVKGVNVASSLTGKVAGLFINNSTEISEAPQLLLRGENPLIVIDGVAYGNMTLNDISSEDIESIDVLKGATASALYGVRGRAGAVMITTKKSGSEGSLTINASNNTMFSAGYVKIPKAQASYSTGNYGKLEYNSGYVWGDYMDGHAVDQYDPITMQIQNLPLLSKGGNNIQNFLRPSLVTNTNVNVSQSGKLGGFRVSTTHVHQTDQYPNTKLDKYMISGGGDITYKNFKLETTLSYKKEMSPNMPVTNYGGGNLFYNMLIWVGNEYDVRDYKNYWKIQDQKQNWPFEAWYDNPYFLMYERINRQNKNLFNTNITMTYNLLKDLSVIFRSGYDNYSNDQEYRRSMGDSGERRGYFRYDQFMGSSFNNDLIIRGNYKWNDLGVDFIGGGSTYWYQETDFMANTRGGLSVPGFYSLNASVERPNVTREMKEKALYSIYGKVGLSYKSGIYVDVTGRNDWSSTLPSSSRSYFYPSVSGSILPTAFYNPIEDILDFWKIRASWTIAKKDMDVYDLNPIYDVKTDVWDGMSTASYPTKLRDPNSKPETERSFEFGTDFRLFNNRLGFDYTYFTRLRYDRLIESPISLASGSEKIITNTQEELKQTGMEFTLRGKPVVTSDFEWETAFNGSFWHWYYHKLDPVYSSKDPRIKEGERYDKFFITDWERDHNGNIVHQAGLPVKNKYQTVMGHIDPKFILGFSNRFAYKNVELNISVDGRIGGLLYSWTEQAMWHSGAHPNSDNQWRYDEVVNGKLNYVGSGSKITSGSASYDPYGKVLEDTRQFASNDVPVSYQSYTTIYNENPWDHQAYQNIKDAGFIKLREVAINYNLPVSVARKILMKNVRVGIIGQNLFIWTKEFKYSDPDRGRRDGNRNAENLNSPSTRYLGFNINVTL